MHDIFKTISRQIMKNLILRHKHFALGNKIVTIIQRLLTQTT